MKSLDEAVALTETQFNDLRLQMYIKKEHPDTEYWGALTYEQYLERRKVLAVAVNASNLGACCMKDPTHQVTNYFYGGDVSITEDALTGDVIESDSSGDVETQCVVDKTHSTDYACNWEDYEKIVAPENYDSVGTPV